MTNDENWAGYRAFLEEFIEIYRGQPCLWRVKSKEYHDRNKKERAYDELIRHYRKIEPNADREAIVKKINNLRTAYRKEVKKVNDTRKSGLGEEEGYVPKLWYFHLLDFLNEQEPPKSLATNGEVSGPVEGWNKITDGFQQIWNFPNCVNSGDLDQKPNGLLDHRSPPNGHKGIPCNPNPPSPQSSESSLESRPRAPKRKFSDQNSIEEVQPKPPIEDRFDVFGKNVVMKLRELPNEQRILAEMIINETLSLAELGTLTMSHPSLQKNVSTTTLSQLWHKQITSRSMTTDSPS